MKKEVQFVSKEYIAGMVDSGSELEYHKWAVDNSTWPSLSIKHSNDSVLRYLKQQWGGQIHRSLHGFTWSISDSSIAEFYRDIFPWLIGKKEEAAKIIKVYAVDLDKKAKREARRQPKTDMLNHGAY